MCVRGCMRVWECICVYMSVCVNVCMLECASGCKFTLTLHIESVYVQYVYIKVH